MERKQQQLLLQQPPSVAAKPISLTDKLTDKRPTASNNRVRPGIKNTGSRVDSFFVDEHNQDITVKFELAGFQTAPEVMVSYGTKCLLKVDQTFHILIDNESGRGQVVRWFVDHERIAFVSEEQSLVIFAQVGGKIHLVFDMITGTFIGSFQLQDSERIEAVNQSVVLTSVQTLDSPSSSSSLSHYLFHLNSNISKFSERRAIHIPDVTGPIQLAKVGLALLANVPLRNQQSSAAKKKGSDANSTTGAVGATTFVRVIHWLDDQGSQKIAIPAAANSVQLIRPDLVVFHSKESGKSTLHFVDYEHREFPLIKTLCEQGSQPIVELDFAVYVKDAAGELTVFNLLNTEDATSLSRSAAATGSPPAVVDRIDVGRMPSWSLVHPSPTIDSTEGVVAMPHSEAPEVESVVPTTVIYQSFCQLRFTDSPVYGLANLPPKVRLDEVR